MKAVPISLFKAKCLRLAEEVRRTGEELALTRRGKPIVKVAPITDGDDYKPGRFKGSAVVVEDLDEPSDVQWDALK